MNWAMPGSTGSIDIWTTEKPKPSQTVEKALFCTRPHWRLFPTRPTPIASQSISLVLALHQAAFLYHAEAQPTGQSRLRLFVRCSRPRNEASRRFGVG